MKLNKKMVLPAFCIAAGLLIAACGIFGGDPEKEDDVTPTVVDNSVPVYLENGLPFGESGIVAARLQKKDYYSNTDYKYITLGTVVAGKLTLKFPSSSEIDPDYFDTFPKFEGATSSPEDVEVSISEICFIKTGDTEPKGRIVFVNDKYLNYDDKGGGAIPEGAAIASLMYSKVPATIDYTGTDYFEKNDDEESEITMQIRFATGWNQIYTIYMGKTLANEDKITYTTTAPSDMKYVFSPED